MTGLGSAPLYRHRGVALLRAAAAPLDQAAASWPDPADSVACRAWLRQVWSRPGLAAAIGQASPGLADRVEAICAGREVADRQVRRAALAVVRYLLRATGRPTPFGLFAGVAPVTIGSPGRVRWGHGHRAVARADTQWLAGVLARLEGCPELLERLAVVFNDLAAVRGGRLEVPRGPDRVSIRLTGAVAAVREAAAAAIRFGVLADKLTAAFPQAHPTTVVGMLSELVRQGFLVTCLRAPSTVVDSLAHVIDRLQAANAGTIPAVAGLLDELVAIQAAIGDHNHQPSIGEQARARVAVTRRMRGLSDAGRTPLAVDLRLDCEVRLPEDVAREVAWAASALVRLTREPTGVAAWREFYAAFCERYGTGSLVPLADVVDPDSGLGFPAGYPGSVLTDRPGGWVERDARLLALAWQAVADGRREIVLDEDVIQALAVGGAGADRQFLPHVEVAARIHAASLEALERGDYTLRVSPARSAGTLTSRFARTARAADLEALYGVLPTATESAVAAQVSVPPVFPHAENVGRLPAYLPWVLPLGEHRGHGDADDAIGIDDLAVLATRHGLHLVSHSRRRVVEPQVLHALALDKQVPPLARFLAHLPRALVAAWHAFDWGPAARELPYLPRVRYRRAVLAPATWRLTSGDLPPAQDAPDGWRHALEAWRRRWHCPEVVELHEDNRSLRLNLTEPCHAAILHAHLRRDEQATLTETTGGPDDVGWLDGHAHEIVIPLVTTRAPAPAPRLRDAPLVTNRAHGHLPGAADAAWLYAKLYTHPERFDALIAEHLPQLLASLADRQPGQPWYWFVRYRSLTEPDHLRLRLHTPDPNRHAACLAAVGAWAQRLRHDGLAGRLVLDTYYPETGRFGHGAAMAAAEEVFAADSHAVAVGLRHLPATVIHPAALTALSMVNIAAGFLGSQAAGMDWLLHHRIPAATAADRDATQQLLRQVRSDGPQALPGRDPAVARAWRARVAALAAYRTSLPTDADPDAVLESLLHLHHNRALGIDPDGERACRRLARQAALTWQAQQQREGTRR